MRRGNDKGRAGTFSPKHTVTGDKDKRNVNVNIQGLN